METIQQLPFLLKVALAIGATIATASFTWFFLGTLRWICENTPVPYIPHLETPEEALQRSVEELEVQELQRVLKGQRVTRRSYRRQMQELQEHVDAVERSIREGQQP